MRSEKECKNLHTVDLKGHLKTLSTKKGATEYQKQSEKTTINSLPSWKKFIADANKVLERQEDLPNLQEDLPIVEMYFVSNSNTGIISTAGYYSII